MRIATEFERTFPKWLIGDSADDRIFVIHLHWPRFVGEVLEDNSPATRIEPTFIDGPGGLTAPELARLMRQAGDFYLNEIKRCERTPASFSKPERPPKHENNQHKT
jgi:hypothetical protein